MIILECHEEKNIVPKYTNNNLKKKASIEFQEEQRKRLKKKGKEKVGNLYSHDLICSTKNI